MNLCLNIKPSTPPCFGLDSGKKSTSLTVTSHLDRNPFEKLSASLDGTYCSGSHVFAAVRDLRLVGVVGTADHGAGGGEAVAPHHAAAGLTRRHPALPQLPVARAGRAPFGVHDGHGRPTFIVEDSRAQTHRDSYKEYSANTWLVQVDGPTLPRKP